MELKDMGINMNNLNEKPKSNKDNPYEIKALERNISEKSQSEKKPFDKKEMIKEVFGGMFVLALALIFAYVVGCPFRRIIGIPCPGCGMSRALIHFVMGEFKTSFDFHPLLFTLPIFFVIFVFWKYIPAKLSTGILIGLAVIFIIVYLYRVFVLKSEVTSICFEESLIYYILSHLGILH